MLAPLRHRLQSRHDKVVSDGGVGVMPTHLLVVNVDFTQAAQHVDLKLSRCEAQSISGQTTASVWRFLRLRLISRMCAARERGNVLPSSTSCAGYGKQLVISSTLSTTKPVGEKDRAKSARSCLHHGSQISVQERRSKRGEGCDTREPGQAASEHELRPVSTSTHESQPRFRVLFRFQSAAMRDCEHTEKRP